MRDRAEEIADGLSAAARTGYSLEDFTPPGSPRADSAAVASAYAAYDQFDTSGLRISQSPIGGTWSGNGESLYFTVEACFYRDPVTMTMPGHDPPVAWRCGSGPWGFGMKVVCCPTFLLEGKVLVGQVPDEVVVLDAEPGQRRCEHGETFDCLHCRLDVLELLDEADA